MAERNREKEVIKRRIANLYHASPEIRAAIDQTIEDFNGRVGEPRSFDALDELMADQAYRPAFWRVATEEINYRRFFDINQLAAIRIERPEVFRATHELIFRLLTEGKVTGLRVDHPDGLWNPEKYFRWLQESYLFHQARARLGGAVEPSQIEQEVCVWLDQERAGWGEGEKAWPLYVVAEKILSEKEPLPEDWAVDGTTGYDFANLTGGLFVNSATRRDFDRIYSHFLGHSINFADLINATKKMIMTASMASEINALSHQLERLAERNRWYRDFTLNSLTLAIREVIACLPVYRTYIAGSDTSVDARDERYVEIAVAEARRRNPRVPPTVFDFIQNTLLLRTMRDFREEDRRKLLEFVMKFQQVTGPVMAKGLEDTAFYIYNRLVSLNEVGGHPLSFGVPVEEFHARNVERRRQWPHSLLASSTHDTKRSEDVRARIDVLSELPGEWRAAVNRWSRLNGRKKALVGDEPAPDRNDEYLLYQTLVGAWPPGPMSPEQFARLRERITNYMLKATKEAKVHTSWVNPNEAYDEALRGFVGRLLPDKPTDRFRMEVEVFQRRTFFFGQFSALAQTLLKLTAPGVPDLYQGTELWDFSLVDPDNRRPVDYEARRRLLAELSSRGAQAGQELTGLARELLESSHDGRIKLFLIQRALHFRRTSHPLFAQGDYQPLEVAGAQREHACAFARVHEGREAIIVVPRLVAQLTGGAETPPLGAEVWKDTRLVLAEPPAGQRYRNLLTGEEFSAEEREGLALLSLGRVLAHFPLALLERLPA
jgi:(1->4)-alpha-D-glucan 1-alpha-D-glucosylmutase